MTSMRERVKEHFPTVLLTLLSIVQALALELLWSHINEADYLFNVTWVAALAWIQIFATFIGLVLIWVVYVSNVMRFSWIPMTTESVFPFLIGVVEFMLVETLGPQEFGSWFLLLAVMFGIVNWVAHTTMRRARLDKDNAVFFSDLSPATIKDFYPPIAIVIVLCVVGVYLLLSGDTGVFALLALLVVTLLLGFQLREVARFWDQSLS